MKKILKQKYIILIFSLLSINFTAILTDIRYWISPESIRIVLDITKEVKYEVSYQQNPDRIIVNLYDVKVNLSVRKKELEIDNETVKKISITQNNKNAIVILFISQKIDFEAFFLKKYLTKSERIVIDCSRTIKVQRMPQTEILNLKQSKKIIVLDPGHGGEDSGAIGRMFYEKNIVLSIAKKLKKIINENNNLCAFLTREDDYFIPLQKRNEIAKYYNADLFISIHTNGAYSKLANGSSVYVFSPTGASNETARILANKENAADLIGGIENVNNDMLTKVLVDLTQMDTLNKSNSFANIVLDEIAKINRTVKLGVYYANFVVLRKIDIPSILVETAFITNRQEEQLLAEDNFQEQMANSIYEGIIKYLKTENTFFASLKDEKKEENIEDLLKKIEKPQEKKTKYHIVKFQETIWKIAKHYNISVEDLIRINKIKNNTIFVGQKIIIP